MQAQSCLLQPCRSSLWCGLCSQVPVCFRWWKLAISLWSNICSSEKINSSSWNTGMTFTILLRSQFLFFYQLCEENWSRLGKSSLGPAPREGGVLFFSYPGFLKHIWGENSQELVNHHHCRRATCPEKRLEWAGDFHADLTDHWAGVGEFPGGSQLLLTEGSVGASKPVYRMFPHTAHQQLLVVFRVLRHQQVLGLTWTAMFTLCSGAALSVLYWMTLRCLQQSESLSFLKRGLPATASCGAFQRGNVGKLFYPLYKKNNRKITIILMPPRNAYYSWTTKVLSLPKALPPFSIFQQQCRDLGTGSKVDS